MDSVPRSEIPKIKHKFLNGDYPLKFINSVIKQFRQKSREKDDFIIPPNLFEIQKRIILEEILYCLKNEACIS